MVTQPGNVHRLKDFSTSSAAALAAGASAAAVPAVWAVRFALAAPHGGALVAYWAALLAAGLPAMHWVASQRRLPTIIIRKVRVQPLDCRRSLMHPYKS